MVKSLNVPKLHLPHLYKGSRNGTCGSGSLKGLNASDTGRGPHRARRKRKLPGHRWGPARSIQSPVGDHASKASHGSILRHTVLRAQPAEPVPCAKPGDARVGSRNLLFPRGRRLESRLVPLGERDTAKPTHRPSLRRLPPTSAPAARNSGTGVPARAGNLGALARH